MSYSPPYVPTEVVVPLTSIPGSHEPCAPVVISPRPCPASCCSNRHYRNLAIGSIICGISCIGIKALTASVRAEAATDPELVSKFSQRARKFSLISFGTCVLLVITVPILMALFSYLVTLKD